MKGKIFLLILGLIVLTSLLLFNYTPASTGLHIKSNSINPAQINFPQQYSFSVVDGKGNVMKDFKETHTKLMHMIVVRKDLANFQHLHPKFDEKTGLFTLSDLQFPTEGDYRIFADFSTDSHGLQTIYNDVEVGDSNLYESLGLSENGETKTFGKYQVELKTHGIPQSEAENTLMFSISHNGKPVTNLEPYLGALGHSVALREETLDFIHAHPIENASNEEGNVNFIINFPKPGKYKIFTQFKDEGKVFTTDFVILVNENSGTFPYQESNHSTH